MGPPTGHIEAGLSSLPGVPLLATQHEGNPSPTPPLWEQLGRGRAKSAFTSLSQPILALVIQGNATAGS